MNDEQRRAYNREQKAARRRAAAAEHSADTFADRYADRIADRIADRLLSALRSGVRGLSAVADTEGVRGEILSAVGTHPAPKVPGVGGCPTAGADADARTNGSADADADADTSPWRTGPPLTDEEREHAQARVRELGDQLRERRTQ